MNRIHRNISNNVTAPELEDKIERFEKLYEKAVSYGNEYKMNKYFNFICLYTGQLKAISEYNNTIEGI